MKKQSKYHPLEKNWFKVSVLCVLAIFCFLAWQSYETNLERANEIAEAELQLSKDIAEEEVALAQDIAEEEAALARAALEEEKEQADLEYTNQRKSDCYNVFIEEREQWNNTENYEYDEESDTCLIWYESNTDKPQWDSLDDCMDIFTIDFPEGTSSFIKMREYTSCSKNWFYKEY